MSKPWIHEDCLELVANLSGMNCSASISDGILTLEDGTQIDLIGCCGKEWESTRPAMFDWPITREGE